MFDKLKDYAGKAKEAVASAAIFVGDINGDGKVDQEDAKIAAEWAKKSANAVGDEAVKIGKDAMRSDMVKDAAAGAAVGAAIAIPVPVVVGEASRLSRDILQLLMILSLGSIGSSSVYLLPRSLQQRATQSPEGSWLLIRVLVKGWQSSGLIRRGLLVFQL